MRAVTARDTNLEMRHLFLLWLFCPHALTDVTFNGESYDNLVIGISGELTETNVGDLLEKIKVRNYTKGD